MHQQWQPDPWGRFLHRLFVDGVPTGTVHNGQQQLHDPVSFAPTNATVLAPPAFAPLVAAVSAAAMNPSASVGWANPTPRFGMPVPGGFASPAAFGLAAAPQRGPVHFDLPKPLRIQDGTISSGSDSMAYGEIDSVHYVQQAPWWSMAFALMGGIIMMMFVRSNASFNPGFVLRSGKRKIRIVLPVMSRKHRSLATAGYEAISDLLSREILPAIASTYRSRLNAGETVRVGERVLTHEGIKNGRKVLPWTAVQSITLEKQHLVVRFHNLRTTIKIPAGNKDSLVLAAVIAAMTGNTFYVSSQPFRAAASASRTTQRIILGLVLAVMSAPFVALAISKLLA
jgi:hypothetical protein